MAMTLLVALHTGSHSVVCAAVQQSSLSEKIRGRWELIFYELDKRHSQISFLFYKVYFYHLHNSIWCTRGRCTPPPPPHPHPHPPPHLTPTPTPPPPPTHLILKSRKLPFIYSIYSGCQIVLKFCTQHGSDCCALRKFSNDLTIEG